MDRSTYRPGMRVRVTQQMPRPSGTQTITVEGTVVRFGQGKTGSWFAHSKDGRLWLDRLELRRDDGELVVCNLDQYSHVDVLSEGVSPESSEKPVRVDAPAIASSGHGAPGAGRAPCPP